MQDCAKRELREKQRILRATKAALKDLNKSFAESAVTSVSALAIAVALATQNVSDADSVAAALLALGLDKNLAAAATALAGSATPSALALQGGMKLLNLREKSSPLLLADRLHVLCVVPFLNETVTQVIGVNHVGLKVVKSLIACGPLFTPHLQHTWGLMCHQYQAVDRDRGSSSRFAACKPSSASQYVMNRITLHR